MFLNPQKKFRASSQLRQGPDISLIHTERQPPTTYTSCKGCHHQYALNLIILSVFCLFRLQKYIMFLKLQHFDDKKIYSTSFFFLKQRFHLFIFRYFLPPIILIPSAGS